MEDVCQYYIYLIILIQTPFSLFPDYISTVAMQYRQKCKP